MSDIVSTVLRKLKTGTYMIPVGQITVDDRRKLRQSHVKALAESIKAIGLLSPIVITKDGKLIAGYHRLSAYRLLGIPKIECRVMDYDEIKMELAEIEENTLRLPLTKLEETKALARAKELYEALHPETRSINVKGGPGRGKKTTANIAAVSFAESVSEKTGKAERSVRDDVAIGKHLDDDVAETIKSHPIADNKSELKKLSKLDTELQKTVAEMLVHGEVETVSEAIATQDDISEPEQPPEEQASVKFKKWLLPLLEKRFNSHDDLSGPPMAAVLENLAEEIRGW